MKVMVIVYPGDTAEYEAGQMPPAELLENMGRFNEELVDAGIMQAGEGLKPTAQGARIYFPGNGKPPAGTEKGPFGDTAQIVGGYWIWNVKSLDEAVEWARRAPMEDGATLELRPVFTAADFGADIEAQENRLVEKMRKQQAG